MWVSSMENTPTAQCSGSWGQFLGHRAGQGEQPQPGSLPISAAKGKRPSCCSQASQGTHPNPRQERSSHHCQVTWKLPGFWQRQNTPGIQENTRQSHSQRETGAAEPALPKQPPGGSSLNNTNKNHTTTTTTTQPSQPLTPFILEYTAII